MNFFLKLLGIILITAATTSLGFYKASSLLEEEKILFETCNSLRNLRDKIRLNYGEMSVIIPRCFPQNILKYENGNIQINPRLPAAEKQILSEYFSGAGMGDIDGEITRADTYIALLNERFLVKQKKNKDLCKLYRTVGFLCGVFLSIFMI